MSPRVVITLVGGPTALIEVGGFRLLTDPTLGNISFPTSP
jgi:L-ascorbate metabolism protein UlaG (beta-lactamase superfamily)